MDNRAPFDRVISLIGAGDSVAAELLCRSVLQADPHDVNMLALLGAILAKMQRMQEAEQVLRQAIAIAPGFAKPHEDLGYVLLALRRPGEAVACLQRAVQIDPSSAAAQLNLGRALTQAGRNEEADEAFRKSFELEPSKRTLAHAWRMHGLGNLNDAERLCRRLLRTSPDDVDAMRLLANISARSGRSEEAERLLSRVIALAPDFAAAHADLGILLKEQDRYAEAIASFRAGLGIEPQNPRLHYRLAATLAPAALTDEAIGSYRRTIELNPKHAGAWLGLGHCLKTLGRLDEAVQAYRECARLRPDNGETWWSLANLKTYRFAASEIEAMKARLAGGKLEGESEVNFLFALAKAFEDGGEDETAWEYYRRGNAKRREDEWYDPVQWQVFIDSIISVFNAELFRRRAGSGCDDPAPIFVVGLPRSGSTLIEQILASHSQVEGTAELPHLGRLSTSLNRNRADGLQYPPVVRELDAVALRALGERYMKLAQVHRQQGKPRFIDKMPNNFPHVGLLQLILPNARIVDARRHPMDACVSCYRQLFARGQPFTYDLTDIGEYYLQYRRVMDHWQSVLPGKVLTVQYEEVVADLEAQVRRLLDHCGLSFEDQCLRFFETERAVRSASSQQVRTPIYTESVGRWQRYERHLGELIEILNPVL